MPHLPWLGSPALAHPVNSGAAVYLLIGARLTAFGKLDIPANIEPHAECHGCGDDQCAMVERCPHTLYIIRLC